MSPAALAFEAKQMNDNIIARDEAEFSRQQLVDGLDERQAEVEKPCIEDNCWRAAEWFYGDHEERRYCDLHVPRGKCSCTIDEDGNQERGEDGRLMPCVDWMYFEAAS